MKGKKLSHCTRCGHAVEPYTPSGEEAPQYWCAHCNKKYQALDFEVTGQSCGTCGEFVPLSAQYCAYCGSSQVSVRS
jgi:hypothetical protein